MLEKYLKFLKGGKRDNGHAEDSAPAPAGESPPLDKVVPLVEAAPPSHPSDDRVVDTSVVAAGDVVTSVLQVATHGKRTDAAEMLQRFIGRQPVLDAAHHIIGYELKLRNKGAPPEKKSADTLQRMCDEMLVASMIDLDIQRLLGGKLAFIGISSAMLDSPILNALPSQGMVLAIHLNSMSDATSIAARCQALIAAGFQIALDDFTCAPELNAVLKLAQYVRIDTHKLNALELSAQAVEIMKHGSPLLIAKNVETEEAFEACRKMSFHYFQGYYFAQPQPAMPHHIDSSRVRVMELLNMVMNHAEISELEEIFKRDAVLSYKLLSFINSPATGLTQKLRSIAHALVMLGYEQLYRWLTLLLFVSGKLDVRSQALMQNALVRARLTETLGKDKVTAAERDGLFIVGIFSLLDVLLNVPMEQALARLSLPDPVVQALLHRQGVYAPFLGLAIACEDFDQELIASHAAACGLSADEVNLAHVKALIWAEEIDT